MSGPLGVTGLLRPQGSQLSNGIRQRLLAQVTARPVTSIVIQQFLYFCQVITAHDFSSSCPRGHLVLRPATRRTLVVASVACGHRAGRPVIVAVLALSIGTRLILAHTVPVGDVCGDMLPGVPPHRDDTLTVWDQRAFAVGLHFLVSPHPGELQLGSYLILGEFVSSHGLSPHVRTVP